MARPTNLAPILFAPLLAGADCAGIVCPPSAPPMTVARAKELDPTIDTGLAFSTTHVYGDCRPGNDAIPTSGCERAGRCARERRPLRVLVVPVNVSIPIEARCDPAIAVDDAARVSTFDGYASDLGELVVALDPGRYTVLVSADDRCAVCGLAGEGAACTVDVATQTITVRDLVLDQSTH